MSRARVALLLILAGLAAPVGAQTGLELIEVSLRQHAPPVFLYREETLILSNNLGQHTVRTLRHYARNDEAGLRSLRTIETPVELRGIQINVARDADGTGRRGADPTSQVFGSDFSVADLEDEQPQNFIYERSADVELDRTPHRVVHALPRNEDVARATGYAERRIYLRKDNLFISRIDYQDRRGRLARRETFRDPRPDESGAWRPSMILMENLRDNRRSLLKIERRVHSRDYIPVDVFAGLP